MGVFDSANYFKGVPTPAPTLGDDASAGLESGMHGLRGGADRVIGTVLDSIGKDGSEYHGAASSQAAQAQASAPSISSFKDVHGLRDFAHYGAGMAGSAAPALVGGAVGGALAGPEGALLGAGAGILPGELGGQIDRARADPANAYATGGQILGAAVPTALASTYLQSVVPGRAGAALAGVGERGVLSHLAGGVVDNAAAMAGAEGLRQGGDNMLNPTKGYDKKAIIDAGIEGAGAGAAFGAVGAAGSLAHGVKDAPGKAFGAAIDAGKKLIPEKALSADTDAAKDAAKPTDPSSITDKLSDLWDSGKAQAKSMRDKMASGQDTAADALATAPDTPGAAEAIIAKDDQSRFQAAKDWANELLKDTLSPEQHAAVVKAATNLADKANQATIATIAKARDAAKATGQKIDDFKSAVDEATLSRKFTKTDGPREGDVEMDPKPALENGVKKSEDYSGIKQAIASKIAPLLQEHAPEVMSDPKKMAQFGDALFSYIRSDMPMDPNVIKKLSDITNGHAAEMLEAVHKTIGGADPTKREEFYGKLLQFHQIEEGQQSLLETLHKNLPEDMQAALQPKDLHSDAQLLTQWAQAFAKGTDSAPQKRLSGKGEKATGLTTEELKWHDLKMRKALEARYGDKAEVVMAAAEKTMKQEENILNTAHDTEGHEGAPMSDRSMDEETNSATLYNRKGELHLAPEHDVNKDGTPKEHGSAAEQALTKAEKENPNHNVSLRSAHELGESDAGYQRTHERLVKEGVESGLSQGAAEVRARDELKKYVGVRAEAPNSETGINSRELKEMTLDTKKTSHAQSKARIDTGEGGPILDAIKMTEAMNKKMPYTEADNRSAGNRKARMFMEAVAAVQAHLGRRFDISEKTIIDRAGTTWGEVRNLKLATEADKKSDAQTRAINKLREDYRHEKDPAKREAIAERGKKLVGEKEFEVIREQAAESNEGGDSANFNGDVHGGLKLGKVRMREIEAKIDDPKLSAGERFELEKEWERLDEGRTATTREQTDMGSGRTEVGKDEEIHTATDAHGEAGVKRETSAPSAAKLDPLEKTANLMKASAVAAQRSLGSKLEKLMALSHDVVKGGDSVKRGEDNKFNSATEISTGKTKMSGPDQKMLAGVAGMKSGERAQVISRLAEKYGVTADKTHASQPVVKGESVLVTGPKAGEAKKAATAGEKPAPSVLEPALSRMDAAVSEAVKQLDKAGDLDTLHGDGSEARAAEEAALKQALPHIMKVLDHLRGKYAPEELREMHDQLREMLKQTRGEGDEHAGIGEDEYSSRLERIAERLREMNGEHEKQQPRLTDGAPPSPKELAAKKAAFLEKARSGDPALIKELSTSTDAKGLQRAVKVLLGEKGSEGATKALEAANARLDELVKNPDTAYGLETKAYSHEAADPSAIHTEADRAEVESYIAKVLGPAVKVAWKELTKEFMHAGEFARIFEDGKSVQDVIRLSVHALDPRTTAYHEALHGFFAKLGDARQGKIMDVLEKAASSASVMTQLTRLLAHSPEALKQLSNAEERAAYMYQFWANGKLKVGGETHGVFAHIAQFIRTLLGTWSNDERALHIMEYFHSGEYAKEMSDPNAVWKSTMTEGRNKALEAVKAATEPFKQIGEQLAVAGGASLRDSGIPALRELANAMKLGTTLEGADVGYVPTARAERARVMNKLGADLRGYTGAQIHEALEALQQGTKAASPEARLAQRAVRDHLDKMFHYMQDAGVKVNDLGVGKDYFPRQWDASYISSHQKQFLAMIDKYVQNGKYKGDPQKLMQKLMVTDGAEFNVEVDKPGMQHLKPRELAFIDHADAALFMRKNLFETMNSYITQGTRRAEWARRFGDDGAGIAALLKKAEQQGATKQQLELAQRFVRGVDGTLGDNINPTARRVMGNMLVYQNIRLLPLAIFSSAVDPLGIIVRGGTVKDAYKTFARGIKEVVNNFKKSVDPDDMTRLAQTMGTIDDAMLVHTLGASYSQGMVGDIGRKINDTFFRYNLMEQFNSSMRVGATEAALNFMVRHADGKATQHSMRYLNELGLKPGDVQLDGQGRPKLTEDQGLSLEHAAKMKAAVNRWVDGAVLRPDAVDKPVWMNDPHFALVAHLKQFVFSFHETILKRVAHEAAHGNYTPALALASYVPTMIAADLVKGMIQGGGQQPSWKQDWGPADYVWSGIERGGLLGSGQFAADMVTDASKGGSGVGALLGPTAEQMLDAVKVMGGRERFGQLAVKSMPANALYASALHGDASDPKFVD